MWSTMSAVLVGSAVGVLVGRAARNRPDGPAGRAGTSMAVVAAIIVVVASLALLFLH